MAITRRPTGTFRLVWQGDEAISDNLAGRIAKKRFEREHDPSVFTPETLVPGGQLVQFTCNHLTRGAMDFVDHYMTPNHRKMAAFRCGVTAISGPGTDGLLLEWDKSAWGGRVLTEESMDRIFDAFPTKCLQDIGEQVLLAAVFGEPEKKVSSQPSGSPSTEPKES